MKQYAQTCTHRWLALACFLLVLTGCASTPTEYQEPPPLSTEQRSALNQKVFARVVELVDEHYFDPEFTSAEWAALHSQYQVDALTAPDTTAFYQVLNRMLAAPAVSHLTAATPRQAHQRRNRSRAVFGFGITFLENRLLVADVIPDSPAAHAGVEEGWILTARNGVPLPLAGDTFVATLGQAVTYDFLDQQEVSHSLTMQPALLDINRVEARHLSDGVLYLRFDEFSLKTMRWLGEQLEDNVTAPAVVLDLRSNLGGNVGVTMMLVAEFFEGLFAGGTVGTGTFITRRGREMDAQSLPFFSANYAGKVVILTEGASASGAEIFSHVLQHHKRATVVGRRTGGNVLASRLFELPDEGLLQIPVSDYLGLDDERLEDKGVTPDLEIPPATLAQRRAGEDPDLEAALALLRTD